MLILKGSTSEKIQLITSAAGSIRPSYDRIKLNGSTFTPDSAPPAAITTATTTDIVVGVASEFHNIQHLSFFNDHATIANFCTVQRTDGTNTSPLWRGTLLPGEFVIRDEIGDWVAYTADGVKKVAVVDVDPSINDFRLSGVTATPVMTADSTSLSTIFLCQYKGNRIALRNASGVWELLKPASEPSLAVTGRTTDLPFDIFAYNNAGVVTLEFLNWTNATTRATGIVRQDGVWVKSGDTTRRWLGSCRARSATTFHWVAAGVDLPCKFDLFNADNRVEFSFRLFASTNTWTYTTATWRQAQASTNYQVDIMVGIQEENWRGVLAASSRNSTISIPRHVGIGFDTTTAVSGLSAASANEVASIENHQMATYSNQPGIGRHFYSWNEISTATGTCTWIGDDGALRLQSGMTGEWMC